MFVTIKTFPYYHGGLPPLENRLEDDKWEVPEGASIAQVLEILNLPEREAKLFFLNGEKVGKEVVLWEGDALQIFPLIGGG